MADTPELGFSVDTSELEAATKALDDVTNAAGRTEQAAVKTGQSGRKMASDFVPATDGMSSAIQKTADAAQIYLDKLTLQLNLLGKSREGQALLTAEYSGFSEVVQQQAAAIGMKIDAWHAEERASREAAEAEKQAAQETQKIASAAEKYLQSLQLQQDALTKTAGEIAATKAAYSGFGEEVQRQAAAIASKTAAIKDAASSARAAALAAKEEAKAESSALASSQKAAELRTKSAEDYVRGLQRQLDMLGRNKSEQAAIDAQYRGFSTAIQQQASEIGKKIDAWHRNEEAAKEAAKAEDIAAKKAELSAKGMGAFSFATAGSTRELIVLAHEAVSGNFSRMPGSFMVLMERAGGLHTAVAALATPFGMLATVGVASMVAVAVAFYEGAQETKAFNNALSLTSNYAGLTADSFEVMSQRISLANHVSAGSVRALLDQLIETGQVGTQQIGLLTDAAERYAAVTGGKAADAAKQFAKALEDPTKGAVELNKQMHFLTLAQYEQIAALQATGREQEAQIALASALDDHMKSVSQPTLGYIQQAWMGVAMAVRDAWDAMKGWGRDSSSAEKIAANNAKIAQLSIPGRGGVAGTLLHKDEIANLQAENAALQKKMAGDAEEAQRKSTVAQVNQEGIAARARYQAFLDKFATPAQRRQQEINKVMQDFDKMIMAGETVTQKQRDDAIQAINDKYKDKKVAGPKIDHAQKQEDQEIARANAAILEAKQQIALLNLGDEKSAEKVTAAQKEINRLLEMRKMSLQSRPGKVSDGQINNEIDAWRKAQAVQEEEQRLRRQKTLEMTANKFSSETTTKWGISDDKTLDKYRQEAELIGQSANQRKLYAAALVIEEEQRSAIAQLMEKTGAKTEQELTQLYPQQVAAINDAAKARREKMIPALEDEIALSQRWETGWSNAFASFQDSAHNNATAAASVFNTMTSSMQSTLITFFNTGKLGWKSFASAILVEIERIMVAKAAAGLLSSAASFLGFGGNASTAGGVSASSSGYSFQGFGGAAGVAQANGGGWMNGVQFYANGDVFNSPTMFSHAGGLGVLGEAGPEAVMPLTRGSDGKLGVKASGGSGGGQVSIQQTFYIGQDGSVQQTGDAGQLSGVTQQMSDAMTNIAKATILQEMQNGGSIARIYGNKQ